MNILSELQNKKLGLTELLALGNNILFKHYKIYLLTLNFAISNVLLFLNLEFRQSSDVVNSDLYQKSNS
jgi:hypothetical protein